MTSSRISDVWKFNLASRGSGWFNPNWRDRPMMSPQDYLPPTHPLIAHIKPSIMTKITQFFLICSFTAVHTMVLWLYVVPVTTKQHVIYQLVTYCGSKVHAICYFCLKPVLTFPGAIRTSKLCFYPRDAMLARVFATATCPSVRPSICRSVCHTLVLCLAEPKQDREMYTIW